MTREKTMTKTIIFFIFFFICMPAGAFGSAAKEVRTGNRYYDKQLFDEAIKHYRSAQIKAPGSAEIHFNAGDAHHRQQDFGAAEAEYNRALSSKDRILRGNAYYNLGNNAYRQEKIDEAMEYYKKALDMNPDDMDAKYNIEYILYQDKSQTKKDDKNKKDNSKKDKKKDKGQQQKEQGSQGRDKDKQDKQEQQEAGKDKTGMSKEDAQRILQYFNDEEKNNAQKRKMMMPQIPKVEEDW